MFKTFYDSVIPMIKESYTPKLQVIFRPQIQPWHPASTLTHEAAVAVLRLAPSKFWDFSDALFREQKEFFDEIVVNETRNETYGRLARLAAKVAGIEEQEMMSMLQISDAPSADEAVNVGNQVTNDLKYLTKVRQSFGVILGLIY